MDPPLPQHKWIFFLSAFVYSWHDNNTMHSISRRSKTNFIFISVKFNKLRLERFFISFSSQLFSFVSIRLSVRSGKWWRWYYLLCEVKVVCSWVFCYPISPFVLTWRINSNPIRWSSDNNTVRLRNWEGGIISIKTNKSDRWITSCQMYEWKKFYNLN